MAKAFGLSNLPSDSFKALPLSYLESLMPICIPRVSPTYYGCTILTQVSSQDKRIWQVIVIVTWKLEWVLRFSLVPDPLIRQSSIKAKDEDEDEKRLETPTTKRQIRQTFSQIQNPTIHSKHRERETITIRGFCSFSSHFFNFNVSSSFTPLHLREHDNDKTFQI